MEMLNHGTLKNKSNNSIEPYAMYLLDTGHIDRMMALQQHVYDLLPNKEVLVMDKPYEIESGLKAGGMVIGVSNGAGELVAYRYIAVPGDQPGNMGYDLNFDKGLMNNVAHLETTVVHPHYRGNNLQSKTLQTGMDLLRKSSTHHLLCTVSPFNFFSLANIMGNGLQIKSLKRKYATAPDGNDGVWRFILHRDLHDEALAFNDYIQVGIDRFNKQKTLLENGFVGLDLSKDGSWLSFAR